MKSSKFDWDCIIIADGEEMLLSEVPGDHTFCTRCELNIPKTEFVRHMVVHHDWKVIVGSTKE